MIATSAQPVDFMDSFFQSVQNAFPSLKNYLSWEDELQDLGPIAPELC
jgi:hypothetical protein